MEESGVSYRSQPCLLAATRGGSREAGLSPRKVTPGQVASGGFRQGGKVARWQNGDGAGELKEKTLHSCQGLVSLHNQGMTTDQPLLRF
jgi:hypothetical protein